MSGPGRLHGWLAGLVAVALVGCGADLAGPSVAASGGSPASASSGPHPSASEPLPTADAAPGPAWLSEPLTDVRTGQPVRLADLAGHIIFIEGMATWCPPCLDQQHEAAKALGQLRGGLVVYVSVDIDPREPASTLRDYVDRNEFGWQFLLTTPAFLRELDEAFGATVLSPPATPVIVVDVTGHASLTEVGIKPASRLVELAHNLGA